jgi:oligosaccharide repeat unit polymerase
MGIFFLTIFLLCVTYAEFRRHDFFSPANIFILLYSLLLFINSFGLSRYQTAWSSTSVIFFAGSLGIFLAAISIVKLHFNLNNAGAIDFVSIRTSTFEEARGLDWQWFSNWIYISGAIYLIGFIEAYTISKQIPLFSTNPEVARVRFVLDTRFFVYAWLFGPPTFMLSFEYLLLSTQSLIKKVPVIIFTVIVAAAYFALVTRVDLFRFFVFALLLFHYTKKRISARTLFVFCIFLLAIFFSFYLIRMRDLTSLFLKSRDIKAHFPSGLEWLSVVYTYIVNNFWNFDFGIRRYYDGLGYYPHEYGYQLFGPVLQLLLVAAPIAHSYGFDGVFNESIVMVKGLNSVIFPWPLLKDFGPFGLFAFSFIYGILVSYFYYNTVLRRPSLTRIGIWSIIAGMLIFSFVAAFWATWVPYMNIALVLLAHGKRKSISAPT